MGSNLKPLDPLSKLLAIVEAHKIFTSRELLADFVGLPAAYVLNMKKHPEYLDIIEKTKVEIARKAAEKASSDTATEEELTELLDREVFASLQVLINFRDDESISQKVRLAAIKEILDRSKRAPKDQLRAQKQDIAPKVILQIPYSQTQTIKKLAVEENMPELIEMLEGEDFNVS